MSAKRKSKQKRAAAGQRPAGGRVAESRSPKSAPTQTAPVTPDRPRTERRPRRDRREEARRPAVPDDGAPAREAAPLSQRDLVWAAAVAALSTILFATTLHGHPGLGDAPESVAGVSSFGVLHAPGYPAYVIAARIFTLLVPFGTFALKVNLFSLVCASLSVAGVYLAARQCGAARWAAGLGGLALATGSAFWFYADFAKHDMFSALLLIAALNLLLAWQREPTTAKLVGFGAVVGIGFGSSWSLMALLLPAAGFVLFLGRRHLSLGSLAPAAAVCAIAAIGLYGFVMARAAADPAVNWGDADNLGRLADLINRADFKPRSTEGAVAKDSKGGGSAANAESSGSSQSSSSDDSSSNQLADTFKSLGVDARIFYAELGLAALVLAFWGLIVSLSPPRAPPAYTLLVMFAVNLLLTAATVGASEYGGLDLVLIQEGFLFGCYFPIAVWVALGATDLAAAAAEAGSPRDPRLQRSVVAWAAPAVLGLAVLLPSVLGHRDEATRAGEPFADRYAQSVFSELPPRSAVFILGAERTQPLVYRQVVEDERPDVVVAATDGLSYDWYRGELAAKLGRELPPRVGLSIEDAEKVIESLRGVRPVYMDLPTAQVLRHRVAYRQVGLLARLTDGPPGPHTPTGPTALASLDPVMNKLLAAERTAGVGDQDWRVWPNSYVLSSYTAAMFEVSDGYLQARDERGLRRALLNVLALDPEHRQARHNLRLLNAAGLPGG